MKMRQLWAPSIVPSNLCLSRIMSVSEQDFNDTGSIRIGWILQLGKSQSHSISQHESSICVYTNVKPCFLQNSYWSFRGSVSFRCG